MFKSIKWFLNFIVRHGKKYIFLDVSIMLLAGILAPISVLCLQRIIDEISCGASFLIVFSIYAGVLVVRESMQVIRRFCLASIYYNIGITIPKEMVHKFQRLEFYFFEKSESRDVLGQIADKSFEPLYELYQHITMILSDSIAVALYLFVIGRVHWGLSVAYLFFLLFNIKINFVAMGFMTDLYDAQTKEERQMNYLSDLLDSKDALIELKVFRSVSYIIHLWNDLVKIVLSKRLKITIRSQIGYAISSLLSIFWMGVLTFIIIWQLIVGQIAIGTFIGVLNCSAALISLSVSLSNHGMMISKRLSTANQYRLFEELAEIAERGHDGSAEKGGSGIEFRDVIFAYPNSTENVLDNISFQIKPGEIVALVGENGAGKSTIIKLLCNLYKTISGRILIDGKEIDSISREELSRLVGVAFQDFERYFFTVRENVALGRVERMDEDEAVKEALSKALAEDLCSSLDQFLGRIDEDGVDLSGGQWQRIAIARALFGEKKYIILDEPTAAIDPVAESEMYQSFRRSLEGRTGLIISHRLASAIFADRILVIDKGKVIEEGTHQTLLEKGGKYAYMWKVQSVWYERQV